MGKGLDDGTRFDAAIGQHAMRPNAHIIAELHAAFKHTADINFNIPRARQKTTHINSRGVLQTHALLHQRVCQTQLVGTLQLG